MKKKKVAIGMSGGVDSGVAAGLLVREGHDCTGFYMRLWQETKFRKEPLIAANQAAKKLGIPFYTVDFSKIFKKKVVDYFLAVYGAGLTPNPCVMCNKFIKFGQLLDYVKQLGFDYLATGHYARVSPRMSHGSLRQLADQPATVRGISTEVTEWTPRRCLLMGKDKTKDQSYFLYNLTQQQLARVLFPVGEYTKKQVRQMAKKWQLPVAERPESQEICFLAESDYRPFLTRQIPDKIVPGEVVDTQGRVIGKHQGIPLYTIGQRHGLTITDKKVVGPLYVIAKEIKKNQLVVGFGKEAERREFSVGGVNWILGKPPKSKTKCQVRIRHQGKLLPSRLKFGKKVVKTPPRWPKGLLGGERVKVILDEFERGIAPGQAAVFYQEEKMLGGGIISC